MGDRRNIYLTDQAEPHPAVEGIYLYSHWSGTELETLLGQALLDGKDRWGDSVYLSRIIVSRVVDDHNSLTGWGLSTKVTDHQHDTLVVDLAGQLVWDCEPGKEADTQNWRNPRSFHGYLPTD